jgi:DnaJ domain
MDQSLNFEELLVHHTGIWISHTFAVRRPVVALAAAGKAVIALQTTPIALQNNHVASTMCVTYEMNAFDANKDYYRILGADETASRRDIERLYKRLASRHHPDRGGSEEQMKALNEAYRVLRDEAIRLDYDTRRKKPAEVPFVPATTPTAQDVGVFGQGLSALLCLLLGFFLLFLVRFQWIWFLWPLAILAFLVLVFGVLLARAAVLTFANQLSLSNPLQRYKVLPEALFWTSVAGGAYGIYLLFTA